ncbi:MAG: hypothetical protein J6B68_01555 [Lachnospiraceae bacterium]|nr:hypothetical protein [Lachnospiraceae bacterium]
MRKFKWMRKSLAIVFLMLMLVSNVSIKANAEETKEKQETTEVQAYDVTELSQIMVAARDVEMKAEPDYDSETLMTYEKGASVFVTGMVEDEWLQVSYQDKTGYVDKTALLIQKLDVAGIDAEMAVEAEETKFVLEEVERYRQEARRSKIWGTIIVVLVIGIFATGIVSTIRAGKSKETDETPEKGTEADDDVSLNIEDLDKDSEENNE